MVSRVYHVSFKKVGNDLRYFSCICIYYFIEYANTKLFLTCLLVIAAVSIVSAQIGNKIADNLDLEGNITVHIKSVPQSKNVLLNLGTYHTFPKNDVSVVRDTLTHENDEVYLTGPCRNVGLSFLHIADSTYKVVGAPGDTIEVSIVADVSKATGQSLLTFEGKNKELQQYYQLKTRILNDPIQKCMNVGISAAELRPFQQEMPGWINFCSSFFFSHHLANFLLTNSSPLSVLIDNGKPLSDSNCSKTWITLVAQIE